MNIGTAAKAAGLSVKIIRHYESEGILPKSRRTEAGYRTYDDNDVHVFRFVRKARDLGFSLPELKQLLSLWKNKNRRSEDVKSIANKHIQILDQKIRELEAMRTAINRLATHCNGDGRPECPILDELAVN